MPRKTVSNGGHAGPFLKWAGGKTQLLPELLKRVPGQFGTYHEPFVGAGALFFELAAQGRIRKARLSDVNPELINCWRALRDDVSGVIGALELAQVVEGEAHFYKVRALDPAKLSSAGRAARFIFLNKTCFNGLYRENSKGIFNVPYGHYAKPRVLDRENLEAVSRVLQGVELEVASFDAVAEKAVEGDFVYFDPPYDPLEPPKKKKQEPWNKSFTRYSKHRFETAEQERLGEVFRALAGRGVHVLLSNSDTVLTRRLYDAPGHTFRRVKAARSINSKGEGRGKINEILVSAGPQALKAVLAG